MIIHLLRHAKAEEKGKKPDAERKLVAKGKQDALKKAKKLKKKLSGVDLVLSSPYPRALQTAEIFAGVLHKKKSLKADAILTAETPAMTILKHVQTLNLPEEALLVGHEPWLTSLASILVSGTDQCQIDLKKPGLITLEVKRLSPGGGTLLSVR